MHLVEVYANSSGVKLDKNPVEPYYKFAPLPEKYITINPSSGMESKNYDHYGLVMDFLMPFFEKMGISFVQLGLPKDPYLPGCIDFRYLELEQSNYVVKNALMHLGNDSVMGHVAGKYGTPTCILFGPTYANVCKPYYHTENSIFIESHRNGNRASHSRSENPKTINLINPEDVASAVLKILNIDEEIKYKSIHIGKDFSNPVVEIIPDFDVAGGYKGFPFVVRMDLHFNEENLARILNSRKAGIITNKPININLLRALKQNVAFIDYEVDSAKSCDIEFVKFLNKEFSLIDGGKRISLYKVSCRDSAEDVGDLKLLLFDYEPLKLKEKIEQPPEIRYKRLRTNSPLLSKGEEYASDWHWKHSYPLEDGESFTPTNPEQDFLSFINNFYIYEVK